jgi:DNA polymerase III delta prime subunit
VKDLKKKDIEEIVRRLIELALKGNPKAARILLERYFKPETEE